MICSEAEVLTPLSYALIPCCIFERCVERCVGLLEWGVWGVAETAGPFQA